ncbi:MAG TPA: LysM peptidoglycan-binding domain-containing M23 family metallopeptidase, partial [Xanthobacteraceae bacterium]|nr:LysM peptidoglycan-binding domain-containing M23 family metallopeptidase [Xanthobacteraceae bacterium]
MHPPAGTPTSSNWTWEGGTAVTVAPGETIDALSRRYGVPASAIMQANHITAAASIQPGQRLVVPRYIPNGAAPQAVPATRLAANATTVPPAKKIGNALPPAGPAVGPGVHMVTSGESLSSIAHRYHKSRKAIAKANNIAPDAKVRIGQRLVIPGLTPPTAPAAPAVAATRPAKPPAPAPRKVADASPGAKAPSAQPAAPASPPKAETAPAGASAHVAAPAAEPGPDAENGAAPAETSGSNPTFRWPVRGRIIAGFGPKTNGQQNDGINLSIPEGTTVKAAEDGVVAYAGNELKGYGNLILVRHNNGFVTAYA